MDIVDVDANKVLDVAKSQKSRRLSYNNRRDYAGSSQRLLGDSDGDDTDDYSGPEDDLTPTEELFWECAEAWLDTNGRRIIADIIHAGGIGEDGGNKSKKSKISVKDLTKNRKKA